MTVTYCDSLGYVSVSTNDCDIAFVDDYAYFSSDNFQSYKIPVKDIVYISAIND